MTVKFRTVNDEVVKIEANKIDNMSVVKYVEVDEKRGLPHVVYIKHYSKIPKSGRILYAYVHDAEKRVGTFHLFDADKTVVTFE